MAMDERNVQRDRAGNTLRRRWVELGFDALLAPEREYVALYWLKCEINNGGLHQYFDNSAGDLAPLALDGLRAVGADETLRLLERGMAVFPPGGYSTEQEIRWKGLVAISADMERQIGAFNDVCDAMTKCSEDYEGLTLDRLANLYSGLGVWSP